MPEAPRFPKLALPFAIVGAAGGWLSAGLMSNPLVQRAHAAPQVLAAIVGAAAAGLSGALLTRFCEREDPERVRLNRRGELVPVVDTWRRPTGAVLAAGIVAGAIVSGVSNAYNGVLAGALGGALCAAAFVPVCLTVLAAARRATRARLGSLVAQSDGRAVYAFLAMALTVATLEALPQWPAASAGDVPSPRPVIAMLVAAGLSHLAVLAADILALRRAKAALSRDLVPRDAEQVASADTRAPRMDLGLGDELAAQIAPPTTAYRGKDRTLALVRGNPEQALRELRRAVLRGVLGAQLVGAVACAHAAAADASMRLVYDERRCEDLDARACARAASAQERTSPRRAMRLYEQACSAVSAESCVAAGRMYNEEASARGEAYPARPSDLPHDYRDVAMRYFERACKYGSRAGCIGMAY